MFSVNEGMAKGGKGWQRVAKGGKGGCKGGPLPCFGWVQG